MCSMLMRVSRVSDSERVMWIGDVCSEKVRCL